MTGMPSPLAMRARGMLNGPQSMRITAAGGLARHSPCARNLVR